MDWRNIVPKRVNCNSFLAMPILSIATIVTLGFPLNSRAEVTEIRSYSVRLDGRTVGNNQMIIVDRNDGTTIVSSRAHVRVKFLFTYTVNYQGAEVWQNGRLQRMDGHYKDHKNDVHSFALANPDKSTLTVRFNQRQMQTAADAWTTSFYKLPEIKHKVQPIRLIDPSTGRVLQGQLQLVGRESLFVAGEQQSCYHFRVSGPTRTTDIWFDVHHRLVRQEFVAMGCRMEIELVEVRR